MNNEHANTEIVNFEYSGRCGWMKNMKNEFEAKKK